MKNIIKAFGLLSIFAVIPGAMAATSRVAMVSSRTSPRLPSIAGYLTSITSSTSSTSSTSLWGDVDCINNYTDCITAEDACGPDFEECTTNVLFHAQMPKCLSVLYQCTPKGIESLFGTSNVNALSNVDSWKDSTQKEVARYTYPLDGSVMGQRIVGGSIANQFTTEQCVRRYTSCLTRDDVCGSDFELCTSQREFKKQAILCDSTLARCQNDGKKELFGSVANADNLTPSGEDVRLVTMIKEGQELAAMNAVKTCQRVTDNCLVSACLANPWRCVEGTSMAKINAADFIGSSDGKENTSTSKIGKNAKGVLTSDMDLYALTGSDIRKTLKAQCLETIGANKYCHMTYREKSPNNKELIDIDLQEDVFSLAYAARKELVNTKIQEELKKFDTEAKDACVDTITSCAMRSCGRGIGSVCYTQAKTTSGIAINGTNTYNDIKSGCAAIVNTDPNCQYAATSATDDGYVYGYNQDVFEKLFPTSTATVNTDPIGVVASLNSLLATSYNEAAIENMRRQCQTVALSCVKSMCGKEYESCYRARTDIVSGTYDTGSVAFDKSMNKMGGVLDYNIIIGLCMNTVKNSSVCNEHLKIAISDDESLSKYAQNTWDDAKTVRKAWQDANTTKATVSESKVLVACRPADDNDKVKNECPTSLRETASENGDCIGIMDEEGCVYDTPVYQNVADYKLDNAGKTLFQELLADVEKEAQAKYNAKLTKEQGLCLAQNNGGIKGTLDNGSTFMWVKLNSNKVPKSYAMKGLTSSQFKASNDLYGSFCRARITVTSDDKDIQNVLGDKATAYFAVGDAFTCGAWIDDKTMAKISEKVGERKLCEEGYGVWDTKTGKCSGTSVKEKVAYAWGTVAPALASLGVGLGLSESGLISNWVNSANENNSKDFSADKKQCIAMANAAEKVAASEKTAPQTTNYLKAAQKSCKKLYGDTDNSICINVNDYGANSDGVAAAQAAASMYKGLCEDAVYDTRKYNKDEKGNITGTKDERNMGARVMVPITTTLVGGALGAGITASVIQLKKEEIKNQAVAEWMEEIGEHIQCYLGADELGSYGDVVSFTIE